MTRTRRHGISKKVGHGHIGDTLIFNNIIININIIISNHIHEHGHTNTADLLLLSLGQDGRMGFSLSFRARQIGFFLFRLGLNG